MVDDVHILADASFMDPAGMTAPVHAADARGVVQEVARSPATPTVYADGQPSSSNHSSLNTILDAIAVMEAKSNDTKKEGQALQEDERVVKKQNVTMAMGVFDCPVCSNPLRPPIFQCTLGHFVCSPCRDKLLDNKCLTCSGVVLNSSCYGMERVVESIVFPCPYAKYGCTDMLTYYRKGEHQKACRHGPCFCPEPGCGFSGSTAALLDHFTSRSQHKWPLTDFKYHRPFVVAIKPGLRVLSGQDGSLFLLNMTLPESPLHAISLVCIQSKDSEPSRFGCSVGFSCGNGHYQLSSLEKVPSSSLSDGLPKNCFCIVPDTYIGARIIIDNELMHDDDSELDEDDDDDSCEEDVDDGLEEEEEEDEEEEELDEEEFMARYVPG